jgi:hypothetical protein
VGLGANFGQAERALRKQLMLERTAPGYESTTPWAGEPTKFFFATFESTPIVFKAKQLAIILTGAGGEFPA